MNEAEKERFNHIAYAYRSWPGTDPQGVLARYNELLLHVIELIALAVEDEREQRDFFEKERND